MDAPHVVAKKQQQQKNKKEWPALSPLSLIGFLAFNMTKCLADTTNKEEKLPPSMQKIAKS